MLVDTSDIWQAVEDALNFCRARMMFTPYYSEASNFEATTGKFKVERSLHCILMYRLRHGSEAGQREAGADAREAAKHGHTVLVLRELCCQLG